MKRVELFLRHVERLGGRQPEYHLMSDPGELPIAAVAFRGAPQAGSITSFSYGLSLVSHSAWVHYRPELVLSVDSTDLGWALLPGELVRRGRGRLAFSYGSMLRFGECISADSEMTSLLVFACVSIGEEDLIVQLPDANVHLVQVYPIHESEADAIVRIGAEEFLRRLGSGVFDVKRTPFAL